MKKPIHIQIIQQLTRSLAIEDIEQVAHKVELLQILITQTLGSLIRICQQLHDFKTEYGEEVYSDICAVLGFESKQVDSLILHISKLESMPESQYKHMLQQIAFQTIESLGLGGNDYEDHR